MKTSLNTEINLEANLLKFNITKEYQMIFHKVTLLGELGSQNNETFCKGIA